MADTGFKVCGAVVSAGLWTNFTTTRLNTSDDSRATRTGTTFAVGDVNNFAFGIPAGATINGIEINGEFVDNTGGVDATLQLSLSWDNGSTFTATKSDVVNGTTEAVKTFGGAADTWGHAFTDTEMADGTFLLRIEGKSGTAGSAIGLDYIEVKVYYTVAGTNTSSTFLLFFP